MITPDSKDGLADRDGIAAYLPEPPRLAWPLRVLLRAVEKSLGKRMAANRILGWYPKALVGSGLLEAFVAHDEPETPKRLLAIVRLFVSFRASCPFCIDMNAKDIAGLGLSEAEIDDVRRLAAEPSPAAPCALSDDELAAIRYAASITSTPVAFDADNVASVRRIFGERGMVILASTAAQVNFWARLIQALGVPPAGFSSSCSVLHLDEYATLRE